MTKKEKAWPAHKNQKFVAGLVVCQTFGETIVKEIMLLERNCGKFLNKYTESFKKAGRLQIYNKFHSLL